MLRAVELGSAGDFVAGFGFDVVAAGRGAGFGRHWGLGFLGEGGGGVYVCLGDGEGGTLLEVGKWGRAGELGSGCWLN